MSEFQRSASFNMLRRILAKAKPVPGTGKGMKNQPKIQKRFYEKEDKVNRKKEEEKGNKGKGKMKNKSHEPLWNPESYDDVNS